MHPTLARDLETLPNILQAALAEADSFLQHIDERPTTTAYRPLRKQTLPEEGLGALGALSDFQQRLEPLIVGSSGPRYWGFVTGGATPAAIAGDWLAAVYDQNTQTLESQGDISAQIEFETIDLLLDLFGLPQEHFWGGFVTGATMSNYTGLAVARQWLGAEWGIDVAKEGVTRPMRVLSATPHSSSIKCLSLLGIGSGRIVSVPALSGNREAMDTAALEALIESLNGEPFILIASGGTVNSVDFDDFKALADLKKRYRFWLHIDAAFGGFAACSTTHRNLLDGWEAADSICVDCHKWLNVPYESAVFFIRKEHRMLQVAAFQNSNAPYLGDPLESFNYLNFLPENSRRLRALPAWFTLQAYGKNAYRDITDRCIALAQRLGAYIERNPAFELLAPVRLNTVCFTLSDPAQNVGAFLERFNASGRVFMTPTVYRGRKGIRAAFVNWRTSAEDVDMATDLLEQCL